MKSTIVLLLAAGGLAAVFARGATQDDKKAAPADAKCQPPLGWWESKDLGPVFTDPKGPAPTTDCDFHVWSWTAFLHWTQIDPATGEPRFLGLPTSTTDPNGPRFARGRQALVLKPRDLKPTHVGDIAQAGPGGVIVDRHGRAAYYSTHFDPIYFATLEKYDTKEKYAKAPPTETFPIGATVIKVSWRIATADDDPNKVFITTASIARLVNGPNGTVVASKEVIPNVKVALIGMHVVGVIKDHPEFAWGTFEHDGVTPDLPPGVPPNSPTPVSDKSFAFYKAGTPAKDCNPWVEVTIDGKKNRVPQPVRVVDEKTQQLSPPINVFLQFAQGGAAPPRAADIVLTNKNFRSGVIQHPTATKPVWANYRLVGTVWEAAGSLKPNDPNMAKDAIGSTSLANATMETYVQGTGNNCFMCHNTTGLTENGKVIYPGKDINLSHAILAPFFEK